MDIKQTLKGTAVAGAIAAGTVAQGAQNDTTTTDTSVEDNIIQASHAATDSVKQSGAAVQQILDGSGSMLERYKETVERAEQAAAQQKAEQSPSQQKESPKKRSHLDQLRKKYNER